jgi:hypothetical protein
MNSGYGGAGAARAAQAPKPGAPMVNAAVPGTTRVKKKKRTSPLRMPAQLATNMLRAPVK